MENNFMPKETHGQQKSVLFVHNLSPSFGKLKMCKIAARQIIPWQNEPLNHMDEGITTGKPSPLRQSAQQ